MKCMVLNSSGNVGKTTITRELLYPFMQSPKIFEIETVNSSSNHFSGIDVEKITSFENFEDLYLKIIENENLILDIGASNLSNFMTKLSEFAGIETLFDFFIVPTTPDDKIATDTARTILYLKSLGIENEKIKVVFNKADKIEKFNILLLQEQKLDYKFNKYLFVPESKLFAELGLLRCTIRDVYNEDVDTYKNEILNAPQNEKLRIIKKDLANRMAVAIYPKLKLVYEILTGEEVSKEEETKVKKSQPKASTKPEAKGQESQISEDDEEL